MLLPLSLQVSRRIPRVRGADCLRAELGHHERQGNSTPVGPTPSTSALYFSNQYSPAYWYSFSPAFASKTPSYRRVPRMVWNLPVPPASVVTPTKLALRDPSALTTVWVVFCHLEKILSPFSKRSRPYPVAIPFPLV